MNTNQRFYAFLLLSLSMINELAYSQVSMPNNLKAAFVNQAPKIDGVLNDEVWKTATKINNFTQRELKFGEPSTEKTEVAIVTTEQYMYVGVWCYDS
jgi:hypothetical protein